MRILRIHIKNLNSLRLQTTVDFEQPPLAHADIFAITGNTGAGKTTILDAITLALYGKVARDKDAHKEVLSYGATECLAEVEFLADNERYLARWEMHRARGKLDGNLVAPTRELAKWSEKEKNFVPVAEKVRDVDEAVREVTGLDFERFTRSVLLSQGDFAAFLKAGDKERSDLLERITGTAVYSELSTAAFERYREEERLLDNLREQQTQLGLLDEEPVAPAALAAARAQAETHAAMVEKLQGELHRVRRWTEARDRIEKLEAERDALAEEETAFAPRADRLDRSLALQRQRTALQTLDLRREKAISYATEATALADTEKDQAQVLERVARAAGQAGQTLAERKTRGKEREVIFRRVERLDTQIEEADKQCGQTERQRVAARTETERLRAEVESLAAAVTTLRERRTAAEQWLEENARFADVNTQLPLIEREREELREVYRRLDGHAKEVKTLKATLTTQTATAAELERDYERLEKERQRIDREFQQVLPSDFSVEERGGAHRLGVAITELQEKKQLFVQLHALEEAYQELLREQSRYEERLESLTARQQDNNKELLNLMERRERARETLDYRSNVHRQQELIANYTQHRQALRPGDPCPLCLSTEHPFHEHPVEPYVDRAKAELDAAQGVYNDLVAAERAILKEETELNSEIDMIRGDELQPVQGRIEEQRGKLLEYEERIAGLLSGPMDSNADAPRGRLLLDRIGGIDEQLKTWREAQRRLETLDRQLRENATSLQAMERKYLDAKKIRDQTEVNLQRAETDLAEAEQRFAAHRERLEAVLRPLGYSFALATARETFTDLTRRAREYATYEKEARATTERLKETLALRQAQKTALLKAEATLREREADTERAAAQRLELRQQRTDLLGDTSVATARQAEEEALAAAEEKVRELNTEEQAYKEALVATRRSLRDTQTQHRSETAAAEKRTAELLDEVRSLGYADLAAVRAALLEPEEEQALQTARETLQRRRAETARALKETRDEEEKYRPADAAATQDWETALKAARAAQEQALLSLGQLEQRLEQQRAREARNKELLTRIEIQRKAFNRWADLNEVIGQKDGKKFRGFAQGLTLQRLVVLANRHLDRLNGRYLISKKVEADLELEIIDTFQADNRRSMYTLSGGESFLISLALALGLSDLAGRHARIESLFIDEGFGTLDEHSLDLAIDTLENLQSSGKTIGIISHVKALKERIGVQIQLHKKSNGFSDLEVRG